MVGFNFMMKIKHFLFPNPPVLFYLLMLSNLFSLVFPFTSTTSFNFSSFDSQNNNISYERAFPDGGVIQLANNRDEQSTVGRATYYSPMHLWDNASTNLADFTTHFSFVIDAKEVAKAKNPKS
ncbi:hypothetical protein I3842_06G160500 [Carya illinoinensis]|uniref:Legume lectin domain-containing protein n=1 Tax=Carya illinoinensis TaxID=32201 RepID=A0A922EXI6_CARIL|nr:hypothetical protein I3842_06G160500 [Carya illinoinensis]